MTTAPRPPGRFIPEPPLVTARRIANREIAGKASPGDVHWLYAHPVWWGRALREMERDVNNHLALRRRDLSAARPAQGENPAAYLAMKAANDAEEVRRLYFKRRVEERRAQVDTLFGDMWKKTTPGDAVRAFTAIALLIEDDDVQGARDTALFWAEKIGKDHAP